MALYQHLAERTDVLADALAEILAVPLADPFASELVVVPAKGVERWLSQRLSNRLGRSAEGLMVSGDDGTRDGVCAGIEFANPHTLIARLLATEEDDSYAPDVLVWPLLQTIEASLDEAWASPIAEHLGSRLSGEAADLRRGRRYGLARRLAWHFGQYAVQRPELLNEWLAGGAGDGAGNELPADLAWQPPLWRALVDRLDVPTPHQRQQSTIVRLEQEPESFDLPARISLFGHTRIAASELDLLGAVARHRDVHLWLPHPSPRLWQALSQERSAVSRLSDESHIFAEHPLLSSLGRDIRELQRTLQTRVPEAITTYHESPGRSVAAGPTTLLAQLQSDIFHNALPTARPGDPADRSVQVHACHGVARQVEVAREIIMGLLADNPSLEPRDIVVMCPDIETFAPLISAAFGAIEESHDWDLAHPAHALSVRLADRSASSTNALLAVVLRLLDVAGSRAQASAVLDLAALPMIRRRFGFTEDDLERLATWVGQAGIRWGFDAEHRADFGLDNFVHNTWRFGLDRMLAGVAMSEDSQAWIGQTLPLDDVGSSDVEVVGRFAEYVERLVAATDQLLGAHPVQHWLTSLSESVVSLTQTTATDAWQWGQLQREFARVLDRADSTELRLPEIRELLHDRTAGRPTRTNFRTGTLTVCTMVPMRSVPHRVVVLLGLDDGVFPRAGSINGDDVLSRDPLTGERDPRSEDRQLFLDAILAATDNLVITYNGANEFTGQSRPPAVPLGEFLDTVDVTLAPVGGGKTRDHVLTKHPLQPFDPRNHLADVLVPGVFSFDRTTLAGAQSSLLANARRAEVANTDSMVLPALELGDVTVAELLEFARSPMKYFLKARLDVALPWEADEVNDMLPVEVDPLVGWGVGDRVLRAMLDGLSPSDAANLEWRRGVMPPGRLGWRQLNKILRQAEPLAEVGRRLRAGERDQPRRARTLDVDVDLGGGRRLRGTVPQVYGEVLVPVNFSRLAGPHRLQSWVNLLALTTHDPGRNWKAHTLGRPTNSRSPAAYSESILGPLDHHAQEFLAELVALRDRGLCEPLPLPMKSSFLYARARRTQSEPEQAVERARKEWEGSDRFEGERDRGEEFRRVLGDRAALPGLDQGPRQGEEFPGEVTRFGALSMRLWTPLIKAEAGGW